MYISIYEVRNGWKRISRLTTILTGSAAKPLPRPPNKTHFKNQ
jgi:hypothetical protein